MCAAGGIEKLEPIAGGIAKVAGGVARGERTPSGLSRSLGCDLEFGRPRFGKTRSSIARSGDVREPLPEIGWRLSRWTPRSLWFPAGFGPWAKSRFRSSGSWRASTNLNGQLQGTVRQRLLDNGMATPPSFQLGFFHGIRLQESIQLRLVSPNALVIVITQKRR